MSSPASNVPEQISYEKLKDGQIRLLRIEKAVDDNEPIVVHLEVYDLIREGGIWSWITGLRTHWYYEALSYQWGSEEKIKPIVCQGRRILIHQNLYDALLALRELRPNVPLWTDSLCINQVDEDEKKSQIQMMGSIYHRAWRVWAFLGPAAKGAEKLMRGLPQVLKVCRRSGLYTSRLARNASRHDRQPPGTFFQQTEATQMLTEANNELLQIAPHKAPLWENLRQLLTIEYFGRLWILQELALAKQVTFLFGTNKLSWTEVNLLFSCPWPWEQLLGSHNGVIHLNKKCFDVAETFGAPWDKDHGIVDTSWYYLQSTVWSFCVSFYTQYKTEMKGVYPFFDDLLSFMTDVKPAHALGQLLSYSRLQECRDPEDHILGVAGILMHFSSAPEMHWLKDAKTCQQLYVAAFYFMAKPQLSTLSRLTLQLPTFLSSHLTEMYSTLEVLKWLRLASGAHPITQSLPSWCPNFHLSRSPSHDSDGFSDMRQGFHGPAWKASNMSQEISPGPNPVLLDLQGINVDACCLVMEDWTPLDINDFSQTLVEINAKAHKAACWVLSAFNAADSISASSNRIHVPSTGIAVAKALALQDPALNNTTNNACDETYSELLTVLDNIAGTTWPTTNFHQERELYHTDPDATSPSWLTLLDRIDKNMRNKSFFITASGYFGLAFQGAAIQDDDILVVFQSATVPHVVRNRQKKTDDGRSTWIFCGEAYVPGIMHGEAERVERVLEETFTLV